jgi:hypothetical protein
MKTTLKHTSFNLTKESKMMIDDLIKESGENQTQVINRAINLYYSFKNIEKIKSMGNINNDNL